MRSLAILSVLLLSLVFLLDETTVVLGQVSDVDVVAISEHHYDTPQKDVVSPISEQFSGCKLNNRGRYGQTKLLTPITMEYNYDVVLSDNELVLYDKILYKIKTAVINALLEDTEIFTNLCSADRIRLYNNIIPRNINIAGIYVGPDDIPNTDLSCRVPDIDESITSCYVIDGRFQIFPTAQGSDIEDSFRKDIMVQLEKLMNDDKKFNNDVVQIWFRDNMPDTPEPTVAPTEAEEIIEREVEPEEIETRGVNAGAVAGGIVGVAAAIALFGYFMQMSTPPAAAAAAGGGGGGAAAGAGAGASSA